MTNPTSANLMKAALVTQLQARPALAAPVVVGRDLPQRLGTTAQLITLSGRVTNQTTPTAMGMGGSVSYSEEYTAEGIILVRYQGTNGGTVEDRAYTLMGEIAAQLDSDPTVSGSLGASGVAMLDGYDSVVSADALQRECLIVMRIKCEATIGG